MNRDLFSRVKDMVNVAAILDGELGPSRKRRWACPFHDDSNPSLSERGGGVTCWGCGWRGDVIKFLGEHRNLGPMDALKLAADLGGVSLPDRPYRKGPPTLEEQRVRWTWESERLGRAIEREARLAIAAGWRRAYELGRAGYEEEAMEVVAHVAAIERTQAATRGEDQCTHGGYKG